MTSMKTLYRQLLYCIVTFYDRPSIQAQIRVIPASGIISVGESGSVPWWAIFVPILAAVIIITVVAVLLWVVSTYACMHAFGYIYIRWFAPSMSTYGQYGKMLPK